MNCIEKMKYYFGIKRQIFVMLTACICMMFFCKPVFSEEVSLDIQSPSVVLMEATTGTVLYEKEPHMPLRPASLTKIMTLLLTFEALEDGRIHLDDVVVTSEHAKSMGGSQVFLEVGEKQTVDTLIKCVAVASGNDAAVALAEYIGGCEEAFVEMMNQKAEEMGLKETHFMDCCGLYYDIEHLTSAKDMADMSRELITKYPQVLNYTGIWMEDIYHETPKGRTVFTLSSTNKLLKKYPYATGLKTGSTSLAKYCLSATASKDGIDLIAVVMAAPDHKLRVSEAQKLLEYGFMVCQKYEDHEEEALESVPVKQSVKPFVEVTYASPFSYVYKSMDGPKEIQKEVTCEEFVTAPIKKGDIVGRIDYSMNGENIGSMDLVAKEDVKEARYSDYASMLFQKYWHLTVE